MSHGYHWLSIMDNQFYLPEPETQLACLTTAHRTQPQPSFRSGVELVCTQAHVRNGGPWRCAITSTDVTYIVESAERVEQPSQTTSLHSPLARLAEA